MIDKHHYELALASQSACNLSGIVIAFAEAMKAMCAAGLDTTKRNKHPISVLYAAQIAHLVGLGYDFPTGSYSQAVNACERGAKL